MEEAAAPVRMLWPARKGDHDPTAMSVLRASLLRGKAKGKVQGHHSTISCRAHLSAFLPNGTLEQSPFKSRTIFLQKNKSRTIQPV
jgi:hypothetical protein